MGGMRGSEDEWATLAHLEDRGAALLSWCPDCARHVSIPLELALARYGRDRRVPTIRARCAVCGRSCAVAPDYRPPAERERERARDAAARARRPAW